MKRNGLSRSAIILLLAAMALPAAGCAPSGTPAPAAMVPTTATPTTASPASSASPSTAVTRAFRASASATSSPSAPTPTPTPAQTHAASPPSAAASASPSGAAGPAADATSALTFKAQEKQFLQSRVPAGTDPNAILQVGQETCDSLLNAQKADPAAVVSELIQNNDDATVAAITNLCPQLQPQLQASRLGFPDGDFVVGTAAPHAGRPSIAPGRYTAWNPAGTCQLTVYGAHGTILSDSTGTAPVKVPAGATRVISSDCYTWLKG